MALTSLPGAGAKLRATVLEALITEVRPLYARKTADETVNGSASLQNDDHLAIVLAASATYEIDVQLFYSSASTPDIKFALTFPTGATCSWAPIGYKSDGTNFEAEFRTSTWQAASGTSNAVAGTAATYDAALIKGIIRVGSTAGTLQVQWAQNTSNGSNTTVKADSSLVARRLD